MQIIYYYRYDQAQKKKKNQLTKVTNLSERFLEASSNWMSTMYLYMIANFLSIACFIAYMFILQCMTDGYFFGLMFNIIFVDPHTSDQSFFERKTLTKIFPSVILCIKDYHSLIVKEDSSEILK